MNPSIEPTWTSSLQKQEPAPCFKLLLLRLLPSLRHAAACYLPPFINAQQLWIMAHAHILDGHAMLKAAVEAKDVTECSRVIWAG